MQFDAFTFIAQIVNFLIVVWVLKRFLYGPITAAMEEREAKIAARLADAEQARKSANEDQEHLRQQLVHLEQTRERLLGEAKGDVEQWRKTALQQARQDVETAQERWSESVRREQETFQRDFRDRSAKQVLAIARRALSDLADEQLEAQVLQRFKTRLQSLDPAARTAWQAALSNGSPTVTLTTAFSLSTGQRESLQDTILSTLGNGATVEFAIAPEKIVGVELRAGGRKIEWSLFEFLEQLDRAVANGSHSDQEGDHR